MGRNAPDEPREGPSYCMSYRVSFTDGVVSELGLGGGLGFCQGGGGERAFYVEGRTFIVTVA